MKLISLAQAAALLLAFIAATAMADEDLPCAPPLGPEIIGPALPATCPR